MSGQELAKKLRDLGFSQVKSHMTALDDFEVLQIQGILEAHGIISESSSQTTTWPARAEDLEGAASLRRRSGAGLVPRALVRPSPRPGRAGGDA